MIIGACIIKHKFNHSDQETIDMIRVTCIIFILYIWWSRNNGVNLQATLKQRVRNMRPYIICHMLQSIDGRIDCSMTEQIDDTNHYYEALEELGCDAIIEGRVTLQMHYAENEEDTMMKHYELMHSAPYEPADRQVYKAKESDKWAVGVDTSGSLYWGENTEEQFGAPLIMILGGWIDKVYLDFLKSRGISYIVTEKTPDGHIDLEEAMDVLAREFHVKRLVVVGGGHLNGSFLDMGLLDEISMMYAAGVDAREGFAASFDGRSKDSEPIRLNLDSVKQLDQIIWARYSFCPYPSSSLERKIWDYLKLHAGGYTSGMAEAFGCSKTDVNSKLYGELTSKGYVERLSQNNDTTAPLWRLVK